MIDAKMIYIHTMGWQCTSLSFEYKMHNIKSVKKKACSIFLWWYTLTDFLKDLSSHNGLNNDKIFYVFNKHWAGKLREQRENNIEDINRSENLY